MLRKLLTLSIGLSFLTSCSFADTLGTGTVGSGCYGNSKLQNVTDFELDSSQYLSRPNADIADIKFGDVDFTVAGWVYMESKASEPEIQNSFLNVFHTTNNQRSYSITYRNFLSVDRFSFNLSSNGAAATVLTDSVLGSPSINTWYFIVSWYDAAGDVMSLQINNLTPSTTAHSGGGFSSSTADLNIGATNQGIFNLDGRLSQWSIWNRVLTATERSQLYNNGNGVTWGTYPGSRTGLLHWWGLSNMNDRQSANYTLTNNNAATTTTGFIYGCS